jgi:hypothetical protein
MSIWSQNAIRWERAHQMTRGILELIIACPMTCSHGSRANGNCWRIGDCVLEVSSCHLSGHIAKVNHIGFADFALWKSVLTWQNMTESRMTLLLGSHQYHVIMESNSHLLTPPAIIYFSSALPLPCVSRDAAVSWEPFPEGGCTNGSSGATCQRCWPKAYFDLPWFGDGRACSLRRLPTA